MAGSITRDTYVEDNQFTFNISSIQSYFSFDISLSIDDVAQHLPNFLHSWVHITWSNVRLANEVIIGVVWLHMLDYVPGIAETCCLLLWYLCSASFIDKILEGDRGPLGPDHFLYGKYPSRRSRGKQKRVVCGFIPDIFRHEYRLDKFLRDPSTASRKRQLYRHRLLRRLEKHVGTDEFTRFLSQYGLTRSQPTPTKFGPAYSSDNAGDGPESDDELESTASNVGYIPSTPFPKSLLTYQDEECEEVADPVSRLSFDKLPSAPDYKGLPAYDPTDFSNWVKDFSVFLPASLQNILNGYEVRISEPPQDEETGQYIPYRGNQLFNYEASRKRSQMLYQYIYQAIRSSSHSKTEALNLVRKYETHQAFEAWQAVVQLHNEATLQNKLIGVQNLLQLRQQPTESALEYKIRTETVFQRVDQLKVKLKDIKVVQFLLGLSDKYTALVDQICLKGEDLTLDQVYREIQQYDQRKAIQAAGGVSSSSSSGGKPSSGDSELDKLRKQQANMAKTIQKLQKQNKGAKPVKKGEKSTTSPQLDNDHSKYPFTATPYERTLTCPVCKTKGHIKRTCWQNAEHIAAMQAANFRPPKRRSTNSTQEERPGSGKKAKLEQAKTAQVSDLNASSRRVVFEPAGPFEGCFLATVKPTPCPSHASGKEYSSCCAGDGPSDKHVRLTTDTDSSDSRTSSATSIRFLCDSGCTYHMSGTLRASDLKDPHPSNASVVTASGHSIPAVAQGGLGPLSNVLVVPGLQNNLFSVSQTCAKGNIVVFTDQGVSIYTKDQVTISGSPTLVGKLDKVDRTYSLDIPLVSQTFALLADVRPSNSYTLWHQRLVHTSRKVLHDMLKFNVAEGFSFTKSEYKAHQCAGICRGCALGKMQTARHRRRPNPTPPTKTYPGRLVFADVLYSPIQSVVGNLNCALLLVDCDTKFLWAFPMTSKASAPEKIEKWLAWMRSHNIPVEGMTTLRTDNGTEFVNKDLDEIIEKCGLKKEMSAPYAHVNQVERAIQTVQSSARSMLLAANITAGFWAEALGAAVYTLNRMPASTNVRKTRYEMLLKEKPDLSRLRTFGCEAWVKIPVKSNPTEDKWIDQSFEGRFMGYDEQRPTVWKIWIPSKHQFGYSDSVIFDENIQTRSRIPPHAYPIHPTVDEQGEYTGYQESIQALLPTSLPTPPALVPTLESPSSDTNQPSAEFSHLSANIEAGSSSSAHSSPSAESSDAAQAPRRSARAPQPSKHLNDGQWLPNQFISAMTCTLGIAHCFSAHVEQWFTDPMQCLYAALVAQATHASRNVPKNYKSAIDPSNVYHDQWQATISAETDSLAKNKNLHIMLREPGMRVLPGTKWVFKVKEDEHGRIARFKARCTALGNLQKAGLDYTPLSVRSSLSLQIVISKFTRWMSTPRSSMVR